MTIPEATFLAQGATTALGISTPMKLALTIFFSGAAHRDSDWAASGGTSDTPSAAKRQGNGMFKTQEVWDLG